MQNEKYLLITYLFVKTTLAKIRFFYVSIKHRIQRQFTCASKIKNLNDDREQVSKDPSLDRMTKLKIFKI